MPEPLTQDERLGKLTTPLGENTLVFASANISEAMSELFEIRVEALSLQSNIDFNSALGLPCTVAFKAAGAGPRYFNGILTEAEWAGTRDDYQLYNLVLRPTLWLYTRTSNSRIFEQMNALDIIKKVLGSRGAPINLSNKTTNTPPTLEYCVQYRETDFAFMSRLMEEYGIYYFFTHEDGDHTLVLADSLTSHQSGSPIALPFNPFDDGGRRDNQFLQTWSRGRSSQSGRFVLKDYDYESPGKNLLSDSDKSGSYAYAKMEMYDYLGDYSDKGQGDKLAAIQAEAAQSLDDRRKATGQAAGLFPGAIATLQNYPEASENTQYIVTRAAHYFDAQRYRSGRGGPSRPYIGAYEFTPSSRPFRAPLDTPRPRISGWQSALVVGKEGEEIDVDELGRIAVQFYWDRDKTASRRIRVAQVWAGNHRGALFLPRIGDEVLVQYEEGDPDRPIVVGSVYNGANEVPADLPAKKTRSGFLTRSSKGGNGYNMLVFDDTAGDEHIRMRSQKALMFKALGDETRDINGSQTETIGGDETINVGSGAGGGNFTINSFQSITLNVGPTEMPLTQIKMDQQSITLSVGPEGLMSQIKMSASGITLSAMAGITTISLTPASVSTMSPTISDTAMAAITLTAPAGVTVAPMLTTPLLTAGAGTVSGLPLI